MGVNGGRYSWSWQPSYLPTYQTEEASSLDRFRYKSSRLLPAVTLLWGVCRENQRGESSDFQGLDGNAVVTERVYLL